MYLSKLKETAANELKAPVSDVVISVPGYFTDAQRRALLDAADIAGLHCLRLINENTAGTSFWLRPWLNSLNIYSSAALGYGIVKSDLSETEPFNVAFVNMGNASFSVSIISFVKGKLMVFDFSFSFANILIPQ
jgi:heat shock protein 4